MDNYNFNRNTFSLVLVFFLLTISTLLSSCNGGSGSSGDLPDPPESIIADPGKERVTLRWLPVEDAVSYTVYYSETEPLEKETATRIPDLHSPSVIRDLVNGTLYFLAIASVDSNGKEGALSETVSGTPTPTPPPIAPDELRAVPGPGSITLSWNPSVHAETYRIYYSENPDPVPGKDGVVMVDDVQSPYIVASLDNDTTYYFIATALNENGESVPSFVAEAIPSPEPPPLPPDGVTAKEGDRQVTISWDPSENAETYNLYYSTDKGVSKTTGVKIQQVQSPYVMTDLENGQAYFFVVTAENQNGESTESQTASATPVETPPVQEMVLIPAGSFLMGDPTGSVSYALPVHTVQLNAFLIDKYETPYELWKEVYDWALLHGYEFDHEGRNGSDAMGTNMPVTTINWYDVLKWCNARSEKEGLDPVYYTDATHTEVYRSGEIDLSNDDVDWTADGYRLPKEAEWEAAARGGLDGKIYPWGDDLSAEYANYNMGGTVSIGLYPPNGYGLHDMAGNVWEWVWDRESEDYTWAGDPSIDPIGPDTGINRIRRGGAYAYGSRYLACHERMFRVPTYNAYYFGFRCARNAP